MDEEIQFPNPVVRHDLPVKRSRRKYVVLGLCLIILLGVTFLPQVLHTSIGTRLLKEYLGAKLGGTVSLGSVRTSWFGGTTVDALAVRDPGGHVIGFGHLQCNTSLWQWIRGAWQLGDAHVDGLYVDYVLDDGFGKGTTFPAVLPRIGGSLSFDEAIIVLSRSRLETGSLSKVSDLQRFSHVAGSVSFPAQGPWAFSLKCRPGDESAVGAGTATASGTFQPGPGNSSSAAASQGSVTLSAEQVPTAPLAWIICPAWSPQDYRMVLGPALDRVVFTAHLDGGSVRQTFQINGKLGSVRCEPVTDLKSAPATLAILPAGDSSSGGSAAQGSATSSKAGTSSAPELEAALSAAPSPNGVAAALSPAIAREQLASLNPLLRYATGEGHFVLRIDSLSMPITRTNSRITMSGDITLIGVKLSEAAKGATSGSLLRQLAALTGELGPVWTLDAAPQHFALEDGRVKLEPAAFTFNGAALKSWGNGATSGPLNMSLALVRDAKLFTAIPALASLAASPAATTSPAPWAIPLVGTADAPALDLDAAAHELPPALAAEFTQTMGRFAGQLRAVENDRSAGGSADKVVNDILSHYDSDAPATEPAKSAKP